MRPKRGQAGEGPARLERRSLQRADGDFIGTIDVRLARSARLAEEHLACRLGCSECCIGPFPITRLDAWRLREGLAELREKDPARAEAILDRARRAVEQFKDRFPGDARSGRLSGDHEEEDRFFERHEAAPCPVLDPETQTCGMYAHRPVSCRMYGPPVSFGGEDLPPCRLCFVGAAPEKVEACRVKPDPDGLERAILQRLRRDDPDDDGETIIACALTAQR